MPGKLEKMKAINKIEEKKYKVSVEVAEAYFQKIEDETAAWMENSFYDFWNGDCTPAGTGKVVFYHGMKKRMKSAVRKTYFRLPLGMIEKIGLTNFSYLSRSIEAMERGEKKEREEKGKRIVSLPYLNRKDNARYLSNKRKVDRSVNWKTYFNGEEKISSPFKTVEPIYPRLSREEREEIFENDFLENGSLEYLGTEKFRRAVMYRLTGFCKKICLPLQADDMEDLLQEFTIYVIQNVEEYFQYVSTTVDPCGPVRFFLYRLYDIVRKYNNGNKVVRSLDAYLEKAGDVVPDERGRDMYYATEGTLMERKEKILAEIKKTFSEPERKFLTNYITGKKMFPYFFAPVKKWNKRTRKTELLPSIAATATRIWNNKFGYIFYIRGMEAREEEIQPIVKTRPAFLETVEKAKAILIKKRNK